MSVSLPSTPSGTLTSALKEWAVAVDALAHGQTIVLLRKGGIREQGKLFIVKQQQVWLYPTYEHQQPALLKPDYASQVQPVASGWHPAIVSLQAWAEITHSFQVSEQAAIETLLPFHIWNPAFVEERLKWKPDTPLAVLLLRVHRLLQPQTVAYRPEYGGCKSWIDLEPLALTQSTPALPTAAYAEQVQAIAALLGRDVFTP